MSFKSFAQILILAILLSLVYSQKQFTGTLTITNDPNMGAGSLLNVKVFYDATNQLIRYDYPDLRDPGSSSNGFSELYDFKNQIFYQLCSVCSVYTNAMPLPIFYTETNDIKASSQSNKLPFTLNSKNCDPFQKQNVPDGGITYIWATPDGLVCRAERTDGLTYNFDISKTVIGQPAATNFVPPNGSKCPTLPRCKTPIDLVLVLDESGSIHRDEWAQLSTFATGVVNSFIIGPNDTQIGLVYFSGVQYATGEDPASCCGLSDPALNMNFDADTINKFLITHQQTGGHTCINCGIKTATTYEPNRNRPIQVPKVMLVLTDGFNNRMQDFFLIDIQNAKDAGWNMFAIGVNNASVTQLTQIASKPEQVFKIDNFDQLETIAKSVTYKLCGAFPTLSPCGPICKGKCGCGGQCICPKCVSPDNCTVSECVNGVSGSQCLFTPKFCDPFATNNDLCKQNVCDKKTGNCTVIPKNCTSLLPDSCYTQTCDPKIGCTLSDKCPPIQNQPGTSTPSLCFSRVCESGKCSVTPKNCTTGANACAVNSCDATLGCISSPINCDDNNMCTTDTCDKVLGCVHTTIDCPSKEFLNSTSYKNNLCLSYKCDPKVGCTSTPKSCDDNNVCTTDNCDPSTGKCSNLAITCPVNTNKCSVSQCDAKAGCIVTPLNCDDNNFCTDDSCDATTGKCKNVPVVCPASNDTCSLNVCDSTARKCVKKPTTICDQPANKCQVSSCVNGKCTASAYNCPPPDLCSTSSCDPVLGCIFSPKVCDDKNNCTKDSCDLNSGSCVFTPIPGCTTNVTCLPNCTSTNPCITATCLNGNCVFIPFTCPINLCATITATAVNGVCQCTPSNPKTCGGNKTACGESVCNPSTGLCGTVNNKVCDDNDPCTIDTCVLVGSTATCNYTQITCGNDSPCSRKKCVATNGQPTCVDSPILNAINCTSTACAVGVCNPASGKCDFTSTNCANPSNTTCARNVCNPVTSQCEATAGLSCPATDPVGCGTGGVCVLQGGVQTCQYNPTCQSTENACVSKVCKVFSNGTICQEVNFTCDDNNPCTIDKCVNDGVDDKGNPKSKCVSTPFSCPANLDNPCKTNQCVNVGGKPTCQLTDIGCNSTSLCIVGKCVVESGKGVCKYNETNCGTPDKCFNYACDPATGCKKISKCNDGNPCTNDLCDTKTGNCTYTQKFCNSSSICQKGVCDPNVGCVQQPLDCVLDKNMTVLDKCHFAICSNTTGCTIAVVPNSLDACGFCNQPGKCAIGRKSTVPAGAIAGAVIGGAIIAGIVALGIGLFAAGGGAAAFTPATQPQMMGGSNNPLYTDGDSGGTNPFDDNDYVPL